MTDWRDILLVAEAWRGRVAPWSLELATKARELADLLGARVYAFLASSSPDHPQTLIHHGVDEVIHAKQDLPVPLPGLLLDPLVELVQERRPEILLLSASDLGKDMGPMLAARLNTGVANDCIDFAVDEAQRLLVAKRPVFGERLVASLVTPLARPQVATLRPGAVRAGFPDESRYGRVAEIEIDLTTRVRVDEVLDPVAPSLRTADVIVAAGAGMPDWDAVHDLAKALNAAVGATRTAIQEGRAPAGSEIGATGARVKPKLYIALGLSGAFDHRVGMHESDWIVAVNPDPEAPIHRVADWSVYGDATAVARALAARVQRRN